MKTLARSGDGREVVLQDDGTILLLSDDHPEQQVSPEFVISAVSKHGWEPLVPLEEWYERKT